MNQTILAASIVERQALRFTPAGVPVTELKLDHRSEVQEAGGTRSVEFEAAAVALGDLARQLQAAPMDSVLLFQGFLARKSRQSKTLVFHITSWHQKT